MIQNIRLLGNIGVDSLEMDECSLLLVYDVITQLSDRPCQRF